MSTPLKMYLLLPLLALAVALLTPMAANAVVLEGVGHAVINNGDLELARASARESALRDVALQYEARIASSDTLNNGIVTDSRLTVSSNARARDVRVISEQRTGNLLRVILQADMSESATCEAGVAAGLKKRVAITGFPLQFPDQAVLGRLDDAGEALPQQLRARLQEGGRLQVLGASSIHPFHDVANAPTSQAFDNSLSNVVALARDLDAQFVVTGVVRSMAVEDPSAWGSSVLAKAQRGLGMANRERRLVVDMMVFDGFSGSPVFQQRFATSGTWDASLGESDSFGSAGFWSTGYGQAVNASLDEMTQAVSDAIRCQPFITRVTRVEGRRVTLASGATAGLRPGDRLDLYRSSRYFDTPGAAPELRDSHANVTLNSVHPDFSNGEMPVTGALVNIQRGDMAIIW
ncbi:flagellar assembly protein T N-terminal domain-containing protein [Marinobacter zhejiangensis]|uniref:Flagellar assembly protein T, C-terminal domain n=1 Tax=Marinobacter zhejiangensis TaxID=488535 RepID=A0A1I4TPP9_9GAMM|nr:flagellar assembly protein T N-terminal domain-containing protein [Marinobacter zhejiangensis]SFM78537.1 Flagellar assembly protein T, C-terminal domain [Marinobacter zhejiangensis]